jgi:hypothetical protein
MKERGRGSLHRQRRRAHRATAEAFDTQSDARQKSERSTAELRLSQKNRSNYGTEKNLATF